MKLRVMKKSYMISFIRIQIDGIYTRIYRQIFSLKHVSLYVT